MFLLHAAHLGDFEPELHEPSTEYITEFKFIPNQVEFELMLLFYIPAYK